MGTLGAITGPLLAGLLLPFDRYFSHTLAPYITVLNRYVGVDRFSAATVDGDPPDRETIVYRDYQCDGAPRFETADGRNHVQQTTIEEMCGTRSIGYDNGDVTLCER